jgi:hypothetical protein
MRALQTLLIAFCLCASAHATGVMEYRYWDWKHGQKPDDYQIAVLEAALEKTVPEFGPYKLVKVDADFSARRIRREVSEGTTVNIHAAPWRILHPDDPVDRRIPVNVPIMNGLLGYRYLLIRREDLPKFAAIRDVAGLKALTAGQGRDWAEVGLYRRNGFNLIDTGHVNTLIPMLANKRFDYLPMSVVEVQTALATHPNLAGKLTVAPNIMISYPLPMIYYVSAHHPELARRLESGLAMSARDGSMDELLRQHFKKEIAGIASVTRHFSIPDPNVPQNLLSQLPSKRKAAHH